MNWHRLVVVRAMASIVAGASLLVLTPTVRAEFDHPGPNNLPAYFADEQSGTVERLDTAAGPGVNIVPASGKKWIALEYGPDGRIYGMARGYAAANTDRGIFAFGTDGSGLVQIRETPSDGSGSNRDIAFHGSVLYWLEGGDIWKGTLAGNSLTGAARLDASAAQGSYSSIAIGNDGNIYAARASEVDRYSLTTGALSGDNWATGLPAAATRLVWNDTFATLYMNTANAGGADRGVWSVGSGGGSATVLAGNFTATEAMALGPGGLLYQSYGSGIDSITSGGTRTAYSAEGGSREGLVFTPIPEPSAAVAMTVLFAGAAMHSRRRTRV